LRKKCDKDEFFAKSSLFSPVFVAKHVNLQSKKNIKKENSNFVYETFVTEYSRALLSANDRFGTGKP
jgi:hypothetical protein